MSLALAPLEPGRWRSRGGASSLRGALLAIGLAAWSLLLRSRVQAAYDLLAAREDADPYYCYGSPHAPPGVYQWWQLHTAALIAPFQWAALITTSATVAFLLVVVTLIVLRWLLRGRQARWADTADAARVNARPRPRLGRMRALALLALLALIVASLGGFAVKQAQNVIAQNAQTAPCASTMTAADYQQLRDAGITLTTSTNPVPVDAQAARVMSRQGLGEFLPARATCVTPQLEFVESSSLPGVPQFSIVWVVGYRIPGAVAGPGVLATPPSEEWTFVDAQSGVYLYGAFMSTVGG